MKFVLKPNVQAFVASLLLVAGVATVINPPERTPRPSVAAISTTTPNAQGEVPDAAPSETSSADPVGAPSSEPGDPAAPEIPGATPGPASTSSPTPPAGPSASPTATPSGSASPSATASPTTTAPPTSSPSPTAKPTSGPKPDAGLYDGPEDKNGITDTLVTFCGHAALALGPAFDTSEADLNVYFEQLNDQGGVHGRKVAMTWADDAYNSGQAVSAAETCKSRTPFALLGGIGFDQIPAVREWAETNKMLYIHHIAVNPATDFRYSFTLSPTVEQTGEAFGQHIATNYRDKNVGIVWRQSENWGPGRDAGRAELDRRGVKVVSDLPVTSGQGVYSQQIVNLQQNGAEVVWLWENALNAAQFITQAANQGYRPKFVIFPFQLVNDTVGDAALNPSIDGVGSWPSYAPGGYDGEWDAYGFDAEIAKFEAAYAEYRPDSKPNDLLWQTWLGNKYLHHLLELCGRDCTRDSFAGMLTKGLKTSVTPSCAIDTTGARSRGGHFGGFKFFAQETFAHPTGPQFRTTKYCVDDLN